MTRMLLDPTRDLRELVAFAKWPFFALAPGQPNLEYRGYTSNAAFELHAIATSTAIATIADADAMIWITSVLAKDLNEERALPSELTFRLGDVLRALGRDDGGRQRRLLRAALDRLATTRIFTTLHPSPNRSSASFTCFEHLDVPADDRKFCCVVIPEWITEQVAARRTRRNGDPRARR
jgi:plasmid replication initiation protein